MESTRKTPLKSNTGTHFLRIMNLHHSARSSFQCIIVAMFFNRWSTFRLLCQNIWSNAVKDVWLIRRLSFKHTQNYPSTGLCLIITCGMWFLIDIHWDLWGTVMKVDEWTTAASLRYWVISFWIEYHLVATPAVLAKSYSYVISVLPLGKGLRWSGPCRCVGWMGYPRLPLL